jgi:hypothetical protein
MPELAILDSTMYYEDTGAGKAVVLMHGNPDVVVAVAVRHPGTVPHLPVRPPTRRNDRSLATSADDFVRNRELWTVVEVTA